MTIQEVLDYVDGIKPNKYTAEEKTQWLNEVEGMIQLEIMRLAFSEVRDYVYASEWSGSGLQFPDSSHMILPRKIRARVGGIISLEGLQDCTANNGVAAEILSISEDGKRIAVADGTFAAIGNESAKAKVKFDGSETELLVRAPFSKIYYDYLLAKISEHDEESSQWNNRLATFNDDVMDYAKWVAETINPAGGRAVFEGYYLKGKDGLDGKPGEKGNVLNGIFEIDPDTGRLMLYLPDEYTNPQFRLNNGRLEMTIK